MTEAVNPASPDSADWRAGQDKTANTYVIELAM
jgi:hypothetical protein